MTGSMEWFIAVVVVVILGVAATAAAGGMGEMAPEPVLDTYRQDLPPDRPLTARDVSSLRFGVGLRGYSMRQVDDMLDRLSREIAERDVRLDALTRSGEDHRSDEHDLPEVGRRQDPDVGGDGAQPIARANGSHAFTAPSTPLTAPDDDGHGPEEHR